MTSIISIGNKLDNRLQNLVYLTRSEHRRLHCTGKKLSDKTKAKMRSSHIGKKHTDQSKTKMSFSRKDRKQVYCVQLNKVFEGISIAGKELSLSAVHICLCCQGKRKTTGGYHFEYYEGDLI